MSYLPSYTDQSGPNIPSNPPSMRKQPPENKPSKLLSRDENQSVFEILGKGRQTLATAVVQLLVPTPDQRHWQKKETGVVCFVRDQTKKSYFIQVLSLRERKMAFRQEIYNQFDYQMPQPFFLTFEGDNSMVGINFADTDEANTFRQVLDNKLEMKRRRRDERIKSRNLENQAQQNNNTIGNNVSSQSNHFSQHASSANGGPLSTPSSNYSIGLKNSNKSTKRGRKEKDGKKNRFKKEDIGLPMNFRHVQHVGWDADKGYDVDVFDKDFQTFFERVGVSANQLKDENTRRFIYNFIEKHGGVEALKNEVKNDVSFLDRAPAPMPEGYLQPNANPPPVPARHAVATFPGKPGAPPPPPSRPVPLPPSNNSNSGPPPPPNRTYPSPRPLPPSSSSPSVSKPSTPPSMSSPQNGGCPPPPPPPPPPLTFPDSSIPPPPPLVRSPNTCNGGESDSSSSDHNQGKGDPSALWKQIQQGVALKPVSQDTQPKRSTDSAREWLGDIKSGNITLKPVPEQVKQQPLADEMDGLAGALARALADRNRALNPSDSDSSDDDEQEEFDEDEWD